MSNVACPHYTVHITGGPMGICRGCGSIVVNPASVQAQTTGLVTASTPVTVVNLPGNAYGTITRADKTKVR